MIDIGRLFVDRIEAHLIPDPSVDSLEGAAAVGIAGSPTDNARDEVVAETIGGAC